jgi:hypothetical protein
MLGEVKPYGTPSKIVEKMEKGKYKDGKMRRVMCSVQFVWMMYVYVFFLV